MTFFFFRLYQHPADRQPGREIFAVYCLLVNCHRLFFLWNLKGKCYFFCCHIQFRSIDGFSVFVVELWLDCKGAKPPFLPAAPDLQVFCQHGYRERGWRSDKLNGQLDIALPLSHRQHIGRQRETDFCIGQFRITGCMIVAKRPPFYLVVRKITAHTVERGCFF